MLGDIDFHSDHPDNYDSFFDFTIDEIKFRYMDFLNLTTDSEESPDRNQNYNQNDTDQQMEQDILKNEQEAQAANKDIVTNLTHEVDELKGSSIETAFQDFNYWKPQVDHNLDELLNQMNAN